MKPSDKVRRTHARTRNGLFAALLYLLLAACATGRSEAQGSPSPDAANAINAPGVIINEILAHTDDPQVDSVEFYNPTATPITMAGWWFADGDKPGDRMILGANAIVPARGFWVLELPEGGMRLKEMGETITLTAIGNGGVPTGYTDSATFLASPNGVSLGRVQINDGAQNPIFFPLQQTLTLGAPNRAPRVGPVVIAEIMYNPNGDKPKYIELLNTGSKTVLFYDSLRPENRWQLEGVGSYAIPVESIAPGASLFVASVAEADFRSAYNLPADVAVVGPFGGELKKSGERVALLSPEPPNEDGTVPYVAVDEVDYGTQPPWPTEPGGEGPALARVNLAGFGQEPRNWAASTLALEAGPAVTAVRKVVLPALGGGRAIQWRTAQEWRLLGFSIWRGAEGSARADAVQVGGLVQPLNSRHIARDYQVIDGTADTDTTYTYWIEAQAQDDRALAVATLNSPPPTLVHLPVVRQ